VPSYRSLDVSPSDSKLGIPGPGMTSGYALGDGTAETLPREASALRTMTKSEGPLKTMSAAAFREISRSVR
jgi:hypothetical protein